MSVKIAMSQASHKALAAQKRKLKKEKGRGVTFSETIEILCAQADEAKK